MADLAALGIQVSTSGAEEANQQLKALQERAKELEAAKRALRAQNDNLIQSLRNTAQTVAVLHGPLGGIASRFAGMATLISQAGVGVATFSVGMAGLTAIAGMGVRAFQQFETQTLTVDQVVRTTGMSAGRTGAQIEQLAQSVAGATLASTQGVRQAAAQLLTFRSVAEGVFDRTISLAQDLASVGFGSISSSAVQLGRALEDPRSGMQALLRVGVSFTASQRDMIRSLQDSGRLFEAQTKILDAVEQQVGGAGAGQARGLAGAWDSLGQSIENNLVAVGAQISKYTELRAIILGVADALNQSAQSIRPETPSDRVSRLDSQIRDARSRAAEREEAPTQRPSLFPWANPERDSPISSQQKRADEELINGLLKDRAQALRELQQQFLETERANISATNAQKKAAQERYESTIGELEQRRDLARLSEEQQAIQKAMTDAGIRVTSRSSEAVREQAAAISELVVQLRAEEEARAAIKKATENVDNLKDRIDASRVQVEAETAALTMATGERERYLSMVEFEANLKQALSGLSAEQVDGYEGEIETLYRLASALADASAARALEEEAIKSQQRAQQEQERAAEREEQAAQRRAESARKIAQSIQDEIEKTQLLSRMLNSSTAERNRAVAALEAEQRIREAGIPKYGAEADAIRRLTSQLSMLKEAYDATASAASKAASASAAPSGGSSGKSSGTMTVRTGLSGLEQQVANSQYGEGGWNMATYIGGMSMGPVQGGRMWINHRAVPTREGGFIAAANKYGAAPPDDAAMKESLNQLRGVVDEFAKVLRDQIRDTERAINRLINMRPPRPDPYAEKNALVFYDPNSDRHFVEEQQRQINVLESQLQQLRNSDNHLRELINISRSNPALFAAELGRFLANVQTDHPYMSQMLGQMGTQLGSFQQQAQQYSSSVDMWNWLAQKYRVDPNDPNLLRLYQSSQQAKAQFQGASYSKFVGFNRGGEFDVPGTQGVDKPFIMGLAGGEKVQVVTPDMRRPLPTQSDFGQQTAVDNREQNIVINVVPQILGRGGQAQPEIAGRNIARLVARQLQRMT
jgi:hypothetical protein